jgi:putative pyruvate formate lyase activating enzyme
MLPSIKRADEARSFVAPGRSALAAESARSARAALADCHLCEHHCGVNRLRGELGRCRAGFRGRVFSAQMEVSDEVELIPTFAIALSGCDLRCAFCITGRESWNPEAGQPIDPEQIALRARMALDAGARTIMILGGEPTVFLPDALDIVSHLPDAARLIWKTNAHGSEAARQFLHGLFDVWVADYKFGNDACAKRLAGIEHYQAAVQENLFWANEHSELIVRHLLMPGHFECCWAPIAEWMAAHLPRVKLSLRGGFWPAWQSRKHPELRRTNDRTETARAFHLAREYNLNLIS